MSEREKILQAVAHLRSCCIVSCPNCSHQTQVLREYGFTVKTIRESIRLLNLALDAIMEL